MNLITRIFASLKLRRLNRRFEKDNYLDAYTESTNIKAQIDPAMAIGGMWNEMGFHQFEFLRRKGLLPSHRMLDIGCGSLRGGILFIDYLEIGNYTGFDLSSAVIESGRKRLIEKGLDKKLPKLLVNRDKNLKFDFLKNEKFDLVLAQSVFSHLMPDHIRECFDSLSKVLAPDGRFFFTHHPGPEYRQRSNTDFEYPVSFFEETASICGFSIEDLSEDYNHPRGQNMLVAQQKPSGR